MLEMTNFKEFPEMLNNQRIQSSRKSGGFISSGKVKPQSQKS
jgi:hypothetical protein